MTKFFYNFKKNLIFGPFWGQKNFSKKSNCHSKISNGFLTTCQNLQMFQINANVPITRKGPMDRKTDRQTLFHRTLPTTVWGPKIETTGVYSGSPTEIYTSTTLVCQKED